jgi:hypothetical protein
MGKRLKNIHSLLVLNLDLSKNHLREKGAITFGDCLLHMTQVRVSVSINTINRA